MIKVLVVSDDMTGNNDVGALLNQSGLNTVAALSDHISKNIWWTGMLCVLIRIAGH